MKNLGIRVTFPKYSGERGGMADWWLIMKTKFELMKLSEEEQSLVVLDSLSSEAHAVFMASLKEGQNTEETIAQMVTTFDSHHAELLWDRFDWLINSSMSRLLGSLCDFKPL